MYPYKWRPEQPEDPAPKDRTACALFEIGVVTDRKIVILPISDRPSEGAIELTADDISRAGLTGFRRAFIHIDQYNLDRKSNSYSYNPRQKPKGRLSKSNLELVAGKFLQNVKAGLATRIVRG